MARVRGAGLQARMRYLAEHGTPADRERVLASLPDETREIVSHPIDITAWYPFEALTDLGTAIDAVLGKGDLALNFELGRFSAEVNMPVLYRAALSLASVKFVMRRASAFWSDHYDEGTLDVVDEGDGTLAIRILGFPSPHRALCLAVEGWATRLIELVGGKVTSHSQRTCQVEGEPWCEIVVEHA